MAEENFTRGRRQVSGWRPRLSSAEADHGPGRDLASARARDIALNSAYGANALRIHRDSVIGPSFRLALRLNYEALGISAEAARVWASEREKDWESYANSLTFDSDAERKRTFAWQMHTAYATLLQSGEAVGIIKWKPSFSGYHTCMLLIEPERLSQPMGAIETARFRRGIEMDEDGAPIAYHIRRAHPNDNVAGRSVLDTMMWDRVDRYTPWGRPNLLHMFDQQRAGMIRGISQFKAMLRPTKLLDTADEAELEAMIMQAGFAVAVQTELDHEQAMGILGAKPSNGLPGDQSVHPSLSYMQGVAPYHDEMSIEVNGAKAIHLLPGEKLSTIKPEHPGLAYADFQGGMIKKLAAASGTSTESLSRDFSKASYAGLRMSLEDIWRHFLRQREMVTRQKGLPFVSCWFEEGIDTRRFPLPNGKFGSLEDWAEVRNAVLARSTFMSWGKPAIDPIKERKGQQIAMSARLTTLMDEAAADGRDYEEILDQQMHEREAMRARGIPLPEEMGEDGRVQDTRGEDVGESGEADRA